MNISPDKRITLSTVKKFIRENASNLFAKETSRFDGMIDCVRPINQESFDAVDASKIDFTDKNTFGIADAWFVGGSRDYFSYFADEGFVGIRVYNCCGSFILATKK